MATLEQLAEAIRRADAAGNAADVMALGAAYRALEKQQAGGDALSAASQASQMLGGKVAPQGSSGQVSQNVEWAPGSKPEPAPMSVGDKLMGSTVATVSGLVNGIPVIGPVSQNLSDAIIGTGAVLTGGNYVDTVNAIRERRNKINADFPIANTAGTVTSAIGSTLGAASVPAIGSAMGMTGSLPAQMGKSALSTLALGTADSVMRGEKPMDAMGNNVLPALIAGAIPGGFALAKEAGKAINNNVVRPIMTLADRNNEAAIRIGKAIAEDKTTGNVMAPAMDQLAQQAGAQVTNADRFGKAIRSLARTASNVSTVGDNMLTDLTQQRFWTQSGRAVNFVKSLMGGATDDLSLQDRLRAAAQTANKAAYDAAYQAPQAAAIWTPEIRQLMASDVFKGALRDAEKVGANDAAIGGVKAIRNPFVFDQNGNVVGLAKQKDGSVALPSLQFWDIVQRNLRNTAEQAARGGDNLLASQAQQMRQILLKSLDSAVPQFQKARVGAAGFFGAQDAIEAGRNAFKTPRQTEEVRRAVAAMKPAEKDAFSVGFASEMIDAINAARDRVNVIENIFGNPSIRERISIALGPMKARELEAYVKMEQTLDQLRVATQGNSTTAKQLIAAGVIGGGGGLLASGGDPFAAAGWAGIAAAGRRGLQMMGKRVDEQVMKIIAEALASGDPSKVQRAIQNASLSQKHMDAIDGIMRGLNLAAKGGVVAGITAQPAMAN